MLLPQEFCLSHEEYRKRMDIFLLENSSSLTNKEKEAIAIFKLCNLDCVYGILAPTYSLCQGRIARDPTIMARAWLLRILMAKSETDFVDELKDPDTATICGFTPGDIPGIGTFADFDKRLWGQPTKNQSADKVKDRQRKPNKPKGDGEKAPSVEKETTGEKIERYLGEDASALTKLPFMTLFKIFFNAAVKASIQMGLVKCKILSGDGTSIETSNRERSNRACPMNPEGKRECLCKGKDKDVDCPFKAGPDQARPCEAEEWKDKRYYSQPDTSVGYDSSRKRYFSGYDLYMITDTESDLPLFPMLNRASMHDSHGFIECFMRMMYHFPKFYPEFAPRFMTLDSAHDIDPIYLLLELFQIGAVIDLNLRGADQVRLPDGFRLDANNIPVCSQGSQLVRTGTDKKKEKAIFQCPKMRQNAEGKYICTCDAPCEKSKKNSRISVPLDLLPESMREFNKKVPRGFTIGENGSLVCPEGLKMHPLGKDKLRCPLMEKNEDGTVTCTCKAPCSKARNGRTIVLPKKPSQPDNTVDPIKEIRFAKDGTPICREGIRMNHNGNNHQRNCAMFRCGLASRDGGNPKCTCENPCSPSLYGKNVCVPRTENLRYYTDPPRESEEYSDIYNLRVASERCNKILKEDMEFGKVKHRSTMMWYIDLFGAFILMHVRKQLAAIAKSAFGVPKIA